MACSSKILITIEGARSLRMPPHTLPPNAPPPRSPFCELHYALPNAAGTLRTRTHANAGDAPEWRERFAFTLSGDLSQARFTFVLRDDWGGGAGAAAQVAGQSTQTAQPEQDTAEAKSPRLDTAEAKSPGGGGGSRGSSSHDDDGGGSRSDADADADDDDDGGGDDDDDDDDDDAPTRHIGCAMLRLSDLVAQLATADHPPSRTEPIRRRLMLLDAGSVQTGELRISVRLVLHAVRGRLLQARLGAAARRKVDVAAAAAAAAAKARPQQEMDLSSTALFDRDAKTAKEEGRAGSDEGDGGADDTFLDSDPRSWGASAAPRQPLRATISVLGVDHGGLRFCSCATTQPTMRRQPGYLLHRAKRLGRERAAAEKEAARKRGKQSVRAERRRLAHEATEAAEAAQAELCSATFFEWGGHVPAPRAIGGHRDKEAAEHRDESQPQEGDDEDGEDDEAKERGGRPDALAPFETSGESFLLAVGCGLWGGLDGLGEGGSCLGDRLEIRAWVDDTNSETPAAALARAAAAVGQSEEVAVSTGEAARSISEAASLLAQGHARSTMPAPPLPGRELGGVKVPLDFVAPHNHRHADRHALRWLPLIPEFAVGAERVKREQELLREAAEERARKEVELRRAAEEEEALRQAAKKGSSRASRSHSRATSRSSSRSASRAPSPEPEAERGLRVAASGEILVELERVRLLAGCTSLIVVPRTTPVPAAASLTDDERVTVNAALYARARARFREYGQGDGLSLAAETLPSLLLELGAGVGAPRVLDALCRRYCLRRDGIEPVTAEQAELEAAAAAAGCSVGGHGEPTFLTDGAEAKTALGPTTMVSFDDFVEVYNQACEEGRGSAYEQYYDVASGRFFYYDAVSTGVCQWAVPADWRGATDAERLAVGTEHHAVAWCGVDVISAHATGAKGDSGDKEFSADECKMSAMEAKAESKEPERGRRTNAKDRLEQAGLVEQLQKSGPMWQLSMDENTNGSGLAQEYFVCPLNGEVCPAEVCPLWVRCHAGMLDSAVLPMSGEGLFNRAEWYAEFLRLAPGGIRPAELHDNMEAERERLVEAAADASGGCSLDLRGWLTAAFEQEDTEDSGEMDAPFFWEVTARLCAQLGLGPAELEALRVRGRLAPSEAGLRIDWSEFTMLCDDALRGLVRMQRHNVPDREDWSCLPNPEPVDSGSESEEPNPPFWYNKRTGAATWQCPFLE
jgi:hypothetical protein